MTHPTDVRRSISGPILCLLALGVTGGFALPVRAQEPSGPGIGPEERALIELDRRRGNNRQALEDLDEILEETPADFLSRSLRASARFEACDYQGAVADGRQALQEAVAGNAGAADTAGCARTLAVVLVELGQSEEALAVLGGEGAGIDPDHDPRDAWIVGRARLETGDREGAFEAFRRGAEMRSERTWETLLAQARCQRALGKIEQSAQTLVAADELAAAGKGVEPDVLVALGDLYFEAYGEVDEALSLVHSPAELYREALSLHADHEGALIGLFELHRYNWRRSSNSPAEILDKIFAARPRSIPGLLAKVSAAIDDGELPRARQALAELEVIAPGRRDVRTQAAALAWVEHRRDESRGVIDELVSADPGDSLPEREVGRHLLELYRFAEGLPFLRQAVERNPGDWKAWTELGRAQANTGDEEAARKSLARAVEVAEGRRDAWRDNTLLVLRRMAESMVEYDTAELRFAWLPDAAFVLRTYLEPFYTEAREELAQRYGYTPGPVKIEVFRRWEDFSVRSTGFQGYPALGVCFGPVVTAVSPLSEMRGQFSWARTSYHEFTHVIHLGLSHNRCPRWITEGLATWEEGTKNHAWWRNMRRELLDARANEDIIPVRRLNNAFRGPRVLFAYFQSGLLCKMLIEEHGFPPMVRLLEAFDHGADLDGALTEVFGRTPEELDEAFRGFVDQELAGIRLEPRWSPENTFQRRFKLSRTPPEDPAERARWAEEWCRVAWGFHWTGQRLDAEEALRLAATAGELPPIGLFTRGELLLTKGDQEGARAAYELGFERGGEDYRARMALAAILMRDYELDEAEKNFLAAEKAFPGYDSPAFSAELRLADLYDLQDEPEQANEARLRWLGYNAGNYEVREQVAAWLDGEGRHEESARIWEEANEVDPFRRHLHYAWGRTLRGLGHNEEALREFDVGLHVPYELDGDIALAEAMQAHGGPQPDAGDQVENLFDDSAHEESSSERLIARWHGEEPLLWGYQALTLLDLDRPEEARAAIEEALKLDPECEPALEARGRTP